MSCLKNVIFFFFYAFNTSALLSLLLTKLFFGSAPQCGGRGGLPTRALPEGVGGTHKSISWGDPQERFLGGTHKSISLGGPTRAFPGGDPQERFLGGTYKSISWGGGTHKSVSWGGPTRAFPGGDPQERFLGGTHKSISWGEPQEHFLKFQCQTILGTVENEYDENIDRLLFVLLNSIPISVLSINSILLQQLKPEHLQLWACCCKGQTNKKSCIC